MEVIVKSTKKRIKKKIEKDLYWYDQESKQRLHGRGGQIIFVYDAKNKKIVPRIVDLEDWVYEDTYEEINEWINKKNIQVINKVPGHYIAIEVSISDWPAVETDLYNHRFMYDYDEKELKQESRKTWQNSPLKWQIRH